MTVNEKHVISLSKQVATKLRPIATGSLCFFLELSSVPCSYRRWNNFCNLFLPSQEDLDDDDEESDEEHDEADSAEEAGGNDPDVEDVSNSDNDSDGDSNENNDDDDDDGENENHKHRKRKLRKKIHVEDDEEEDDTIKKKKTVDNDDNAANFEKKTETPVVHLNDKSLHHGLVSGMGSEISFVSKHGPAKFFWLKGDGKGSKNNTEM